MSVYAGALSLLTISTETVSLSTAAKPRYDELKGGEEFLVVLLFCSDEQFVVRVDQIREVWKSLDHSQKRGAL
jgi:hypothetical protein